MCPTYVLLPAAKYSRGNPSPLPVDIVRLVNTFVTSPYQYIKFQAQMINNEVLLSTTDTARWAEETLEDRWDHKWAEVHDEPELRTLVELGEKVARAWFSPGTPEALLKIRNQHAIREYADMTPGPPWARGQLHHVGLSRRELYLDNVRGGLSYRKRLCESGLGPRVDVLDELMMWCKANGYTDEEILRAGEIIFDTVN